ncbi:MAG: hypothetical protein ACP5N2_06120 [Candidatus Nanoarchaeia archaeon]
MIEKIREYKHKYGFPCFTAFSMGALFVLGSGYLAVKYHENKLHKELMYRENKLMQQLSPLIDRKEQIYSAQERMYVTVKFKTAGKSRIDTSGFYQKNLELIKEDDSLENMIDSIRLVEEIKYKKPK